MICCCIVACGLPHDRRVHGRHDVKQVSVNAAAGVNKRAGNRHQPTWDCERPSRLDSADATREHCFGHHTLGSKFVSKRSA